MRKKILAFVFAAALLVAMAVPLSGGGTAQAAKLTAPNGTEATVAEEANCAEISGKVTVMTASAPTGACEDAAP